MASTSTRWRSPASCCLGHLGEVLDLLDPRDAGAALGAGDERLAEQPGARAGGDAGGRQQGRPPHHRAAEQQGHRLAGAQHLDDLLDGLAVDGRPARSASGGGRRRAVAPRHVGRQDQRGDLAGRSGGLEHRLGRDPAEVLGALGPPDPRRHVARRGLDVRRQRGVEAGVVRGVVADDVDDRRLAPAGRCAGWRGRCRAPDRGAAACTPGRRPCGRSRRRPRWRRPRTGRARRASPGTASRAATKCISLVPGFVKHVVTPASTSVRIMAWAPFMATTRSRVPSGRGDMGRHPGPPQRADLHRPADRRRRPRPHPRGRVAVAVGVEPPEVGLRRRHRPRPARRARHRLAGRRPHPGHPGDDRARRARPGGRALPRRSTATTSARRRTP